MKLSRKGSILSLILFFLVAIPVSVYLVGILTDDSTQVAPDDSSADGGDGGTPPIFTPECGITVTADCIETEAGTGAIYDGVGAKITWNVTGANFDFGDEAGDGKVVIRINNLEDAWFTEDSDTFWGTNYMEFKDATPDRDPASSNWDFDVRKRNDGPLYDSIKAGVDYKVWASAYTTHDSETPVCETAEIAFTCGTDEPPITSCGDGECSPSSGETCEIGSDGKSFSCPTGGPSVLIDQCRTDCTYCGDGIKNGNEQCDDGNNVNGDGCSTSCQTVANPGNNVCGNGVVEEGEECDDGNAFNSDECSTTCEIQSQSTWGVTLTAVQACLADQTAVEVTYTIKAVNGGSVDGAIDRVIAMLDDAMDPTWIVAGSPTPAGAVVSGRSITWESSYTGGQFAPGASRDFTYKVSIPVASYGTYVNSAEIVPSGLTPVSATQQSTITCAATPGDGSLPDTAIFDSTLGKVGVGLILVSLSGFYFMHGWLDRTVLRVFSSNERHTYAQEMFERRSTSSKKRSS